MTYVCGDRYNVAPMTNTKIINESAPRPQFRVQIKVGVAYGTDVEGVEEILLSVVRNNNSKHNFCYSQLHLHKNHCGNLLSLTNRGAKI